MATLPGSSDSFFLLIVFFVVVVVISVVTMPVISESDARNFCSSEPSVEQISSLDRHELALVAQCLEIVLSWRNCSTMLHHVCMLTLEILWLKLKNLV